MQEDDHSRGIDSELPRSPYRALAVGALVASILTRAALWVLAAVVWPHLPDRFPAHFNLKGEPDRFVRKEFASWYMLPLIAAGTTVLLAGVSFIIRPMTRGDARWLNVPRKKDFVRLPPEARARALMPLWALLWGTPAPMNVMFAYVVWGTYLVATKRSATLSMTPMIVALVLVLAWTAVGIIALRRAIIDEVKRLPPDDRGDRASVRR